MNRGSLLTQRGAGWAGSGRGRRGSGAYGRACVSVAFDAEAGDEADREGARLAEAAGGAAVDGEDGGFHRSSDL
jgi:hypothetical protein